MKNYLERLECETDAENMEPLSPPEGTIEEQLTRLGDMTKKFHHWLCSTAQLCCTDQDTFVYLMSEFNSHIQSKLMHLKVLTKHLVEQMSV